MNFRYHSTGACENCTHVSPPSTISYCSLSSVNSPFIMCIKFIFSPFFLGLFCLKHSTGANYWISSFSRFVNSNPALDLWIFFFRIWFCPLKYIQASSVIILPNLYPFLSGKIVYIIHSYMIISLTDGQILMKQLSIWVYLRYCQNKLKHFYRWEINVISWVWIVLTTAHELCDLQATPWVLVFL